ncbi:hypothetical protein HYU95_02985 [Candidatus Daviesbacteria bacterium]|nr:hypothetical protein [Candidatus Daviesbacteria bacterium]
MKVLLHGKNAKDIENLVKSFGFVIVAVNPDLVISYGGDGTLLSAERIYPGVLKLPMRNSLICKKCLNHEEKTVFEKLSKGKLKLTEYKKLKTTILYKDIYALNDFVARNSDAIHTIRFRTSKTRELFIGDGIVVSTPFGSTGYFKSITRQTFKKGFGVAFNNPTEKTDPLFLKEDETFTFKLIRGQATLSFDNNPDIFTIDEGSELVFQLSNKVAKIYEAESLRCPDCKVTRG